MPTVFESYLILLYMSSAVCMALAVFLWDRFWRKRGVAPARTFAFMMAAVSFWALGCALALHSGDPGGTYLWERLKYAGMLLVPPLWFLFSLQWTGRDRKWPRAATASLFLASGMIMILVITDPWHHLVWAEFRFVRFGPYLFDEVVHGPVWWGLWAYASGLILMGIITLIGALTNLSRTYRVQAALIMISSLLPWISNLYFASGLSPLLVDVTPVFFILSCVFYIWGFSCFRMIDLVPVARDKVFAELSDPLFILDLKLRVLDLNRAARTITGKTESDLLGKCVWDSVLEPFGIPRTEEGLIGLPEGLHTTEEGWNRYYEIRVDSIRESGGRATGHILVFRDLTERRKAEVKLLAALKEKEILLQEIHHRVKNNMQLVVSLLRLQGSRIEDPDLREVFETGESRIRSMALIHEKLYMTRNFAELSLKDFIQDMCRQLWRVYDPSGEFNLKLDVDDVHLDLIQSIPCGLIIHELLSNALQHAFPENRSGQVRISLHEKAGGGIELSIADNGCGIPPDFDLDSCGSLGLTLVRELTAQLDGALEMPSGSGACFRVNFTRAS